jgi:FixJ family two-component response regulator
MMEPIVFVVDDDAAARTSVENLLHSVGLRVQTFDSATKFLEHGAPNVPSCLVLDVRLPRMSGIELQRELAIRGISVPIIFITGHGDIPMSVEAMKAGAMEFLVKPFRGQVLLDAIHKALERDRATREEQARVAELRGRFDSLTPREREVMNGVIAGRLNKEIAAELGAAERTIKVHRANVMRKLGAESLADLVRMSEKALPWRKHTNTKG